MESTDRTALLNRKAYLERVLREQANSLSFIALNGAREGLRRVEAALATLGG